MSNDVACMRPRSGRGPWTLSLVTGVAAACSALMMGATAPNPDTVDGRGHVGVNTRMLSHKSRPGTEDHRAREWVAFDAQMRMNLAGTPHGGRVDDEVWESLAGCESNHRWDADTGNGFYGGLQFTLSSWRFVGGAGYPHEAPRRVQIAMAERLLDVQGWRAWPACSRALGLR